MKSNEDVEWGVIFSEASGCLYHRRVFDQKEGGSGGAGRRHKHILLLCSLTHFHNGTENDKSK